MIRYSCPSCGTSLQSPPERAGTLAACPTCKSTGRIPAAAPVAAGPPPAPTPPPPPPIPAPQWYVQADGLQVGPLTAARMEADFRAGKLTHQHLVWKEGLATWVPAGQVPGLLPPAASPPPPPSPPAAVPLDALPSGGVAVPSDLLYPVLAAYAIAGIGLLFSLIASVSDPNNLRRFAWLLLPLSLAHTGTTIVFLNFVVRLRKFPLAQATPYLVLSCWLWLWLINVTHSIPLMGMVFALGAGVWLLLTLRRADVPPAFDAGLPPLISPNRTWLFVGSLVAGWLIFLVLLGLSHGNPEEVFVLLMIQAFNWWMAYKLFRELTRKSLLLGRWTPEDAAAPPLEFTEEGMLLRGDQDAFRFRHTRTELDLFEGEVLRERWKIVKCDEFTLVLQDPRGPLLRYRRNAIGAFKSGLASLAGNMKKALRDGPLHAKWAHQDPQQPGIQFTVDGAFVSGDGTAGHYAVDWSTKTIHVRLTDGTEFHYRIVSNSPTQLVLSRDGKAHVYTTSLLRSPF